MTDTSQGAEKAKIHEGKEADHHPYFRPRDAATLILVDRSGSDSKSPGRQAPRQGGVHARKVRLSRRPRRQGRLPRAVCSTHHHRAGSQSRQGQPEDSGLARQVAGDCRNPRGLRRDRPLPRTQEPRGKAKLEGAWKPFADAGLLPDPSSLFLIARAITPPGRVKRFDTRFFTADASAITHRVEGVIHADAELVELVWVELGSKPLADLHPMTRNVLNELDTRLATGPLRHDAPVPFFHFYGGKMQKDILC